MRVDFDLHANGTGLLRPTIAMSWRRSEAFGLVPDDSIAAPAEVDYDASSRLVRAAGPVLESICDSLSGIRAGGLLADAHGTIVGRYFGDGELDAATEQVGGSLGMPFDESRTGTNAIATCHETREPVNVLGDEHFLGCLKGFDCYGLPILNPVTRRLEGVIDLMMDAGAETGHRRALEVVLERMVREIQLRVLTDYDPDVQQSLAAFKALSRRTDDLVLLVGRDFVIHNRRALDELAAADLQVLEALAAEGCNRREVRTTLKSGREVAVQAATGISGQPVLMRVHSGVRVRPPVPRALGTGTSDLDQITARLDELAELMVPVMVSGERGSGRSWAAQRIAGPDAFVVAAAHLESWQAIPPMTSRRAVVIEEVDQLAPTVLSDVAAAVRSAGQRVVMTVVLDARDDAGYLAGLCAEWVELPPLRERLNDIPQVVSDMLRQLAPPDAAEVRLTAPALELLRRHRWPGNFSELATVVQQVRERRSAGDVSVTDLPERYQRLHRVRPSLTPFEQAEWELIERTLAVCHGNKVHTARRLGISRSKLYARLRYFQID